MVEVLGYWGDLVPLPTDTTGGMTVSELIDNIDEFLKEYRSDATHT
jgi:predicted RNase H-like HicB family nuclease